MLARRWDRQQNRRAKRAGATVAGQRGRRLEIMSPEDRRASVKMLADVIASLHDPLQTALTPRFSDLSDAQAVTRAAVRCNLPLERRSNLTMPRLALLSGVLAGSLLSALPASAATALQAGDASITQDESAGTWTIAAGGSSMTLALAPARDFNVVSLMSASGRNWALGTAPGTFIRVLNQSLPLGWHNFGFNYQSASASAHDQSLQLDATFLLATPGLRLTRHFSVTSGSPAIRNVDELATRRCRRRACRCVGAERLPAHCAERHDSLAERTARRQRRPRPGCAFAATTAARGGQHLSLGSPGRSSQTTVPWFGIDGTRDEFFAALMWSGAWALDADRIGPNLSLTMGLAPMTTTVTTSTIATGRTRFSVSRREARRRRPPRCDRMSSTRFETAARSRRSSPTTPGSPTAPASTRRP